MNKLYCRLDPLSAHGQEFPPKKGNLDIFQDISGYCGSGCVLLARLVSSFVTPGLCLSLKTCLVFLQGRATHSSNGSLWSSVFVGDFTDLKTCIWIRKDQQKLVQLFLRLLLHWLRFTAEALTIERHHNNFLQLSHCIVIIAITLFIDTCTNSGYQALFLLPHSLLEKRRLFYNRRGMVRAKHS